MKRIAAPVNQDDNYQRLVENVEQVKQQRITDILPRQLFEPRLSRSLLGFAASYSLYIGALVLVSVAPHWIFYPFLWLAAGLGGWGLHCIAHDCGHHSFSRSRRLNSLIGHLSLLPMLYPFHAWRHVHNMHHAATNHLEQDTDWRPLDPDTYERMPLLDRWKYYLNRTFFFWLGTAAYWRTSAFRPDFFPQSKVRAEVRRSITLVVLFSATWLPALVYFTGWQGLLMYFVAPWLCIHLWFSITTLMHHTAQDLPFLTDEHWNRNGSRLFMTTDYLYPRWLHFLTHNISIHTAHHVAPAIPSYNLPQATRVLHEAWPGRLRQRPFHLRELWRILRGCHLYDPQTGYYMSFGERRQQRPDTLSGEKFNQS